MGKSTQILSNGGSLFIDEFDRKNKNKENKTLNNINTNNNDTNNIKNKNKLNN